MTASKTRSRHSRKSHEFVERFAVALERDGFPRIAGRIYALLTISDADLSLDEIAAALGASKASASTNTRMLEDKGLIQHVSRSGDRRNYYRIAPDFFLSTMEQRLARWDRVRSVVKDGIADSTLPPHARNRLRNFDDATGVLRDLFETTLNTLRKKKRRN
jgi:DNA-binding transcriptional regulator GbsR (MarR family)